MKIASVRIENFRSFKDETIPFNDYTCLVGPNGAGKSTVLTALSVFFCETDGNPTDLKKLDEDDFHCRRNAIPVKITVTFKDLSVEAKKDFSAYVWNNQLVVTAEAIFEPFENRAVVKLHGQCLGMLAFAPYYKALKENWGVDELRKRYAELKRKHAELEAASTKDAMTNALHKYEAERPNECKPIQCDDELEGKNRLAKHAQWIYVPALKDANSEQVEERNSALGKLLARTVRSRINFEGQMRMLRGHVKAQYKILLNKNQYLLDEISKSLESRLSEWAHPEARLLLQWKEYPDKSIRIEEPLAHILAGDDKYFQGEISRFGHGLQRSYLFALLQELSETVVEESPTLILACEEPELYQHPPQCRHLASVLSKLSRGNTQVIVASHNPLFVSGEGFQDVRMVRKEGSCSYAHHMSFENIAAAVGKATRKDPLKLEMTRANIHQALQPALNEMFFTRRLILVEGLEDVAYLQAYIHLLDKINKFRSMGCHIVHVNGKSELLRPLVISKHMKIPTYLVFDSDNNKNDQEEHKAKHEKDNKALLRLVGGDDEIPFPEKTIWGKGFTSWHSDIGTVVKDEIGDDDWEKYSDLADRRYGGNLKKNLLHTGDILFFASKDGKYSESLKKLCCKILEPDNFVPFE